MALRSVKPLIRQLKALPFIRQFIDRRRYSHFMSEDGLNSCYGVFTSFEQARKRLPHTQEFNKRDLADEYVSTRMHRLFQCDYPVMYWLNKALSEGASSIFDIGGSVGIHYYTYKKFISFPSRLTWKVCETPAVAEVGREIAAQSEESKLSFTDTLDTSDIDEAVWISSGAIQYIEHGNLSTLIAACKRRPDHIILNKVPVYEGEGFVTTQNISKGSYAPFYVYNRLRILNELTMLGYQLVDDWPVPERNLYIPGHPEKSFESFTGMYLRLNSSTE